MEAKVAHQRGNVTYCIGLVIDYARWLLTY